MIRTSYRAPAWLAGAHLQTIIPASIPGPPRPAYRRERWATPDRDFIDVDWVDCESPSAPLCVLFHGLEGNSGSHYARALMRHLQENGWRGAVPHFRGCSGELNHAPRFYHSGDSVEIGWILGEMKTRFPDAPVHAVGVSLGGNALLRWLGESAEDAARTVVSAAAVSVPLDLTAGGWALSSGFNRLYTSVFLRTLKPKCAKKLEQYPGLFDHKAMAASRNLHEFDNVVTAPLHGYRDADDYWSRASSKLVLQGVCVPTLVLNALNDPFLPSRALPGRNAVSRSVRLEYPETGGHVGFYARTDGFSWLPRRITHFLSGDA